MTVNECSHIRNQSVKLKGYLGSSTDIADYL